MAAGSATLTIPGPTTPSASRWVSSGQGSSALLNPPPLPLQSSSSPNSRPETASGAASSPTLSIGPRIAVKLTGPWLLALASSSSLFSTNWPPPGAPGPARSPVMASLPSSRSTERAQRASTHEPSTSPEVGFSPSAANQPWTVLWNAASPALISASMTKRLGAGSAAPGASPITRSGRPASSARARPASASAPASTIAPLPIPRIVFSTPSARSLLR